MASMSISGVVSGMDWDSMINEIITAAAKPAQVQVSKRTNLQNKKSLFEEMKVMVQAIQTSMTSLKLPSTYKAKAVDIERIDSSGSYKGVLTAAVNADAEVNVHDIVVQQLASAQTNRSKQITASSIASTLSSAGITDSASKMYITAAGQRVGVDVYSTDSLQSLKSRINTTLKTLGNPLDITASVVDNRLVIKSDNTGLGTKTAEGTVRGGYSSTGVTSLTGLIANAETGATVDISVTDENIESLKVMSGGTTYTEGTDYVVVNGTEIRWKQYDRGSEVALGDSLNARYTMAVGDVYSDKGTVGDEEAKIFGFTAVDNGTLADRLKIVDDNGVSYTYGEDFTLKNGVTVEWLEDDTSETNEPSSYTVSYSKTSNVNYSMTQSSSTITSENWTDFAAKYIDAYSLDDDEDLPTLTLTDSNEVLRTYFDPSDRSDFTMTDTASGTTYEYGRDYVIRVNDSGTGWQFDWTITGDTNSDGNTDINDANTVVTTYMQEKGITTYGVQTAPTSGSYIFSLSKDVTVTDSGTVKSSADDDDKVLSAILEDVTVSSDDYASAITIKSGDTTYTYGTDYTIDSSGYINWLTQTPAKPATDVTFTVSYTKTTTLASEDLSASDRSTSGMPQDTTAAMYDSSSNLVSYASITDTSKLYIKDSYGNTYTYGTDFTIDSTSDTSKSFAVNWIATDKAKAMPSGATYNVYYDETSSTVNSSSLTTSSSYNVTTLTGSSDYDGTDFTITDSAGNTYSYGKDFTINDDGTISWVTDTKPSQPDEGVGYTLTYEAYEALTATATYTSGATTTALSDFSGVELEYADIFSDVGTSSKQGKKETESDFQERIDNKFANAFTLTDGTTTYTYATDYRVTENEDTGLAEITWLTDGAKPADGASLIMTYTGRGEGGGEVLNMPSALTRSNADTINLTSGGIVQPFYTLFEDASSVRITGGSESFELGTDFTISQDSLGYAVINWNTDTITPPVYANHFDGEDTTITVKDSDGNSVTGFTIAEDSAGKAVFSMDDGSILDAGSYTVSVVRDNRTKIYDLTSDGTTMTLTQRSAWDSQDVSKAGTYSIYVSNDGETYTFTGTRPKGSYDFTVNKVLPDFDGGTTTITQGTKTFYEGVDFNIGTDSDGIPTVEWIPDSEGGYEWYYPYTASTYTVNHVDTDGNTTTFTAVRNRTDTISLLDYGMTTAGGTFSVQYGDDDLYYVLEAEDDEGNTGNDVLKATHSFTINKREVWSGSGDDYSYDYVFNWLTPELTSRSLPSYGDEISIEYEYDANTFGLSDDMGGSLIEALGLEDEENVTEAHNAIILLDGSEIQRDSNDIGETYGNEISNLKGVTLNLKGLGEVSLDIYHDAEKAVEAITTFKDNYNDLMTWMNTRMTESQVDEDTASTIDSDDFRMRWGLLHGNALLRQTKSQMRDIMANTFTYSFTQRTSAEEVYGTMSNNGLQNNATLRIRIGDVYSDLTISPTNTLQDIVDMISDSTNPEMRNMYYGTDGKLLEQPRIKASISDDKLVLSSTDNNTITISGTAAMNALKLNYTYTGLFQLGIATTSTDYGKSGELDFDESKFMEALEENADETQELMLMFANKMDTWVKSMLTSSATGETKGTLSRQIDDIDTQIKSIDEYLEKYQERLDRQEEALRTKFAAAEQNISKLSQQAASIASILNMLNNSGSNSNSSSASS